MELDDEMLTGMITTNELVELYALRRVANAALRRERGQDAYRKQSYATIYNRELRNGIKFYEKVAKKLGYSR